MKIEKTVFTNDRGGFIFCDGHYSLQRRGLSPQERVLSGARSGVRQTRLFRARALRQATRPMRPVHAPAQASLTRGRPAPRLLYVAQRRATRRNGREQLPRSQASSRAALSRATPLVMSKDKMSICFGNSLFSLLDATSNCVSHFSARTVSSVARRRHDSDNKRLGESFWRASIVSGPRRNVNKSRDRDKSKKRDGLFSSFGRFFGRCYGGQRVHRGTVPSGFFSPPFFFLVFLGSKYAGRDTLGSLVT